MAGAQKRVTQEFFWRGSNNVGNYVIFTEDDQVHLAMVDFEETVNYQEIMFKFLTGLRRGLETSNILGSMDRSIRYKVPEYFRQAFARGFTDGYRDSDRRDTITCKDLSEAFNLKV